jgi:hypothetical protein
MKYRHLSSEQVAELHARCFVGYYFRSRYFRQNAHLLWPWLRMLGIGRESKRGALPRSLAGDDRQAASQHCDQDRVVPAHLTQITGLRKDPPHALAESPRKNESRQKA